VKITARGVCSDCKKFKSQDYLLKAGALPIWYKDGVPQYHVPEELSCLSMAEMMLIQLNSPFIPLQHIKNGTFGLSGHVCSFEQDLEEFVNRLPRHKNDTTMLKVIKAAKEEFGHSDKRNDSEVLEFFKVNKMHVGRALRWLKKFNVEYEHIKIDMSALDWLEGNIGTLAALEVETPEVITREDNRDSCENEQVCLLIAVYLCVDFETWF
jgi:hypothetical protein